MKAIVKLAVLLATLLLLTSVAFAQRLIATKFTCTDLDHSLVIIQDVNLLHFFFDQIYTL